MRWTRHAENEERAGELAAKLEISETIASLILRLGIESEDAAAAFLEPRLKRLDDPFRLTGMAQAVERVCKAMERNEKVLVFGDYDVDGVTSTAFLVSVFNSFGIYPDHLVPLRLDEGYGLSQTALDRALEENGRFDLLIAVDCGTNSCEEVAYLRSKGIDVIILDHHTTKGALPEDCVLVNPHAHDAPDEPWHGLCAVGLVFKFVHALLKTLRDKGDDVARQIDIRDYLDLVALGTVADLAPLTGENRILVKIGLDRLSSTRRLGLNALYEVSDMTLGEEVAPFDIGFRLGPRINASGRLGDASLPIQLLLSEDRDFCVKVARQLDDFNRERQSIERAIFDEADTMVDELYSKDFAYVLHNPEWHPGVVGIVASRIAMKRYRPCIVLGEECGVAKGSGRSVAGIDLVEALTPCSDLLSHWGGHPMAVGVSLDSESLDAFRKGFNESVRRKVGSEFPEAEIEIARWIDPDQIDEELMSGLSLLRPFGSSNPEPVFGIRSATLSQAPRVFGNGHYRFFFPDGHGRAISGVAWKQADNLPPVREPIDIAAKLAWNVYNNQPRIQAQLIGWRHAERA